MAKIGLDAYQELILIQKERSFTLLISDHFLIKEACLRLAAEVGKSVFFTFLFLN
jgi:hypothetical protein